LDGVANGRYFAPGELVKICAKTTSADALGLSAALTEGANNLCVRIGTSTPQCAAATLGGGLAAADGACVTLTCPGKALFDVNLGLRDSAGNITTAVLSSLSCASTLPSVQIIDPVDGTGSDVATHILASSAAQIRKDENAGVGGAQYTVRACTDADVGASGVLLAGLVGGAKVQVGSNVLVVAKQLSDNCPNALGNTLVFSGVTLPESVSDSAGLLTSSTELAVSVTDISRAVGVSPVVNVWVDTTLPTLAAFNPPDLCSLRIQSDVDATIPVTLTSTVAPITLAVDRPVSDSGVTLNAATAGRVTGSVLFEPGVNSVSAQATEPSGNSVSLAQPCTITVGNPPTVVWTSPGGPFNKANDGDSSTLGWQGTLSVNVSTSPGGIPAPANTGTVTFTANGNALGTVSIVAGAATLSNVTIPEGASVALLATTSDFPPFGVGSSTTNVLVDSVAPGPVAGLSVVVSERRQTSFQLSWTGASDAGSTVGGYSVKSWRGSVCDVSGFAAGTSTAFSGTPAAPGAPDGLKISGLLIENDYCFGVQASDQGLNQSAPVVFGPARAQFNITLLDSGSTNNGSRFLDGSSDIDGDGKSDLLVGVSNGAEAYLYWGAASGFAATPGITFSGTASTRFGIQAKVIGDIDNDGLLDVAISATLAGGAGTVYIFKGRANWRAISTLNITQAAYTITYDSVAEPKAASAQLGTAIARLGDFDGDGIDDVAIGAPFFDALRGIVVVVRGKASFPSNVSLGATFDPAVAYGITGEATSNVFGSRLLGFGKFYSTAEGTTLVATATAANPKRVYTFTKPAAGLTSASAARHILSIGNGTGQLSNVGLISGSFALGIGGPNDSRVYYGNETVGPFGGTSSLYTSSVAADPLSNGLIGSALPGTAVGISFIGGSEPDAVIVGKRSVYIMRSTDLVGSTGDITPLAPVAVSLPTDWVGSSWDCSAVRDLDGDGYADFAVGEFQNVSNYKGRVQVFW